MFANFVICPPPLHLQISGSKIYVFGGLGAGPVGEMWAFDLKASRWAPVRPHASHGHAPPAGRCGHTLTTDGEGRLWMFGGQAGKKEEGDFKKDGANAMKVRMMGRRNVFSDSWCFDPKAHHGEGAWHEITIVGISPSPRRGHTTTYVVGRRQEHHHHGDDDNASVGSASIDSTEVRRRQATGGALPPQGPAAHELLSIGGAGPDPGKGFEQVHGQVWCFDLKRRDWRMLETSGLASDATARFDHTATLVGGGMAGASAAQTLVVLGGVSGSSFDNGFSASPDGDAASPDGGKAKGAAPTPTYSWGKAETRVLALAVDTLVWTELIADAPSTSLLSSFSGDEATPAPSLHGHTACLNPMNAREVLVFGGRGEQAWSGSLYALTLPPAHVPGTPYPGMPKKKSPKKGGGGSNFGATAAAQTRFGDSDGEGAGGAPEPRIQWEVLSGVKVAKDAPHGYGPPEARYGHVAFSWVPPRGSRTRGGKRSPDPADDPGKEGKEGEESRSEGRSEGAAVSRPLTPSTGGGDLGSEDMSPAEPGLLVFGGSLFNGVGSLTATGELGTGYASADVHFLDLDGSSPAVLRGKGPFQRRGPSHGGGHTARSVTAEGGTRHGDSALRHPPKSPAGRVTMDTDDGLGLASMSTAGSGLSQSQALLAKLAASAGSDELPAGYGDMKQLLLGQRSDHLSSKIKKGDTRLAPARSSLGLGMSTGMSGLSMAGIRSLATGTASGGSHVGGALGGGVGHRGGATASATASTMAYRKMRKLASHDARFGPSAADVERSVLMADILAAPQFPPQAPDDPCGGKQRRGADDLSGPAALYAATVARSRARPKTAAELFELKQRRPMTSRQEWAAKWEVPGLRDLVDPPARPVITAVEAKRRFKTITPDPFAQTI